jgi:hypothetical protein
LHITSFSQHAITLDESFPVLRMRAQQQLAFNWTVPQENSTPAGTCLPPATDILEPAPPSPDSSQCRQDNGSIELPWDFVSSFPPPLPAAIEAGQFGEREVTDEHNASVHAAHATECLAILEQLDALEEAKGMRVDPRTGKKPRTPQTRERLRRYLETAPVEARKTFDTLMDVYTDAYGSVAAHAFRQALEATHAGLQIRVKPAEPPQADAASKPVTETQDTPNDESLEPPPPTREDDPAPPVAVPLTRAVERAVFGEDEFGPVEPSPEEVSEITQVHAEKLIELRQSLDEVNRALGRARENERPALIQKKDRALCAYQQSLGLYEEDFGRQAAERLDAWVREQVYFRETPEAQYDPGHPWHYYAEGDGMEPMSVDEIAPTLTDEAWIASSLPKNRTKRVEKLRQMLGDQESQLAQDKQRYIDLVKRGAQALSDYDRQIAHGGNDELAWASSIALKYNHIRNGLGRVAWLKERV